MSDRLLLNVGINDLHWSHGTKSTHTAREQMLYRLWWNMLHQCYSWTFKKQNPSYKEAKLRVCERWKTLSHFVEDVQKLPGYEDWYYSALYAFNHHEMNMISLVVVGHEYNPMSTKFSRRSTHKRKKD